MPPDLNLTSIETCPGAECVVFNNMIITLGEIIPVATVPGVLLPLRAESSLDI
jgi:hypothetical protein